MKKKSANLLSFFVVHNEWLSLTGFILISAVFWFLLKLSKPYAITRKMPVTYVYAGERLPDSIFTDTLVFDLKGSGWKLLQWEWEHRRWELPYTENGTKHSSLQEIFGFSKGNTPVKGIKLIKNKKRKEFIIRKLPVRLLLQRQEIGGRGLDVKKLIPSDVLAWGRSKTVKRLKYIPTKDVGWDELEHRSVKELALNPPKGIVVFPGKIKFTYHLQAFTRENTDITPEVPDSLSGRLVLFPSKVHIEYKRWVDAKQRTGRWKVVAVPVRNGQNLYFRPVIKSKPSSVFDVQLSPEKFDYLIKNE